MTFLPGDVALVRSSTFVGWAIRLVTRSYFNHVRLVVSADGDVIEALGGGVKPGRVQPGDIVIRGPMTDAERARVPALAEEVVGTPYGFLDVAALGLAQFGLVLPGLKRRIKSPKHLFCSQTVDLIWARAGFHVYRDRRTPQDVTPGEIGLLVYRRGWQVIQHMLVTVLEEQP